VLIDLGEDKIPWKRIRPRTIVTCSCILTVGGDDEFCSFTVNDVQKEFKNEMVGWWTRVNDAIAR
jgi:hypothetical protein